MKQNYPIRNTHSNEENVILGKYWQHMKNSRVEIVILCGYTSILSGYNREHCTPNMMSCKSSGLLNSRYGCMSKANIRAVVC